MTAVIIVSGLGAGISKETHIKKRRRWKWAEANSMAHPQEHFGKLTGQLVSSW
jgi:hypothetical protein